MRRTTRSFSQRIRALPPFAWPVPQPAPYCSQVAARRPIFVYVRRQKIWKKPHGTQ